MEEKGPIVIPLHSSDASNSQKKITEEINLEPSGQLKLQRDASLLATVFTEFSS